MKLVPAVCLLSLGFSLSLYAQEAEELPQVPQYKLSLEYAKEVPIFRGGLLIDMNKKEFNGLAGSNEFELGFEDTSLNNGWGAYGFHRMNLANHGGSDAPASYNLSGAQGHYQMAIDLVDLDEDSKIFFLGKGKGGVAVMRINGDPLNLGIGPTNFTNGNIELQGDTPHLGTSGYLPDGQLTSQSQFGADGDLRPAFMAAVMPGLGWTNGKQTLLLLGEAEYDWERKLNLGAQVSFRGPIVEGKYVRWTFGAQAGWKMDVLNSGKRESSSEFNHDDNFGDPCGGRPFYYDYMGGQSCASHMDVTSSSQIHQFSVGLETGICAGPRKAFCIFGGIKGDIWLASQNSNVQITDANRQIHHYSSESSGFDVNGTLYTGLSWQFDIGGSSNKE